MGCENIFNKIMASHDQLSHVNIDPSHVICHVIAAACVAR